MSRVLKEWQAGDFRSKVEVQARTDTPDGQGGFTKSFATAFFIYAAIREVGAGEHQVNHRLMTGVTLELISWYRPGITTLHRVMVGGMAYNIRKVEDVQTRSKYLRIQCEKGVEQ